MSVFLDTTTIAVTRPSPGSDIDPYVVSDDIAREQIASGIRAHISAPGGREIEAGGSQEVVEWRLYCDLVDLQRTDRVEDENTGETYEVLFASQRLALGMDHVIAGLKKVSGTV